MGVILDRIADLQARPYVSGAWLNHFENFIVTGDEACLPLIKAAGQKYYWSILVEPIDGLDEIDDEARRLLIALLRFGAYDLLVPLVKRLEATRQPDTNLIERIAQVTAEPVDRLGWARAIAYGRHYRIDLPSNSALTSLETFLLSLTNDEISELLKALPDRQGFLRLLCERVPERVPSLMKKFIRGPSETGLVSAECCDVLMTYLPDIARDEVKAALTDRVPLQDQCLIARALARAEPDKYLPVFRDLARQVFESDPRHPADHVTAELLISTLGEAALPDLDAYFENPGNTYWARQYLETLTRRFGDKAVRLVAAAAQSEDTFLAAYAFSMLVAMNQPDQAALIESRLLKGLSDDSAETVTAFLDIAPRAVTPPVIEALWKVLEHKSKPVRERAARILGGLAESQVERAGKLLLSKRKPDRAVAVLLLTTAQSEAATKLLEARVDVETDESVRDDILIGLAEARAAQGVKMTPADFAPRIARTAGKLKTPVKTWLDETNLPALKFADGAEVGQETVRYLLYRQSRVKEMRPDVEAGPLYALFDRTSAGDLAIALLQSYLGTAQEAGDRWVLVSAAMLADDRLVKSLSRQIREWADSKRGKLAEYAVQALALMQTDVALCAVDGFALRYRSKQKNVGAAAAAAFAEAAARRKLSIEELGDRVVPWLDFEPGKPLRLEIGPDKAVEVRIGSDFKPRYLDLAKNKVVASLPAAASAAQKAAMKDLAALLREVVKGQVARLEMLMVRQFRWPVARWRELYLMHPILRPFSERLIWGHYDDAGALTQLFRALDDGSLTDANDDEVTLPESGEIGIVHPLELTPEQRTTLTQHLADYKIEPPFSQLDRQVILCQPDQRATRISEEFNGRTANSLSLRGKGERLGWTRGSVVDGGAVSSLRKDYPGAGVTVILMVDGMHVAASFEDSVELNNYMFVKLGTSKTGSYTYDEPTDADDARIISFGDVPPIVFSETQADLKQMVPPAPVDD